MLFAGTAASLMREEESPGFEEYHVVRTGYTHGDACDYFQAVNFYPGEW